MLEHFVEARVGSGRSWVHWGLVMSAIGHTAVVAFLVVSALWRIDKLSYEQPHIALQLGMMMASPPPPAGSPAPVEIATEPESRRVVRDAQATPASADDSQEVASGEQVGEPGGDPNGKPGGTGTDPTAVIGDVGCGAGKILCTGTDGKPPPEQPPEEPIRIVPPKLIDGKRYSGSTNIQPPDTVVDDMSDQKLRKLHAVIKLCLSRTGRVSSVTLLRSSGFPAYDRKLVATVRTWRYHAYKLDSGQAVPVCTSVVFNYTRR